MNQIKLRVRTVLVMLTTCGIILALMLWSNSNVLAQETEPSAEEDRWAPFSALLGEW